MSNGKRWEVLDRYGNEVYLTDERWEHITTYHPELADREGDLLDTVRSGHRKQEEADPQKYRYRRAVDDLPGGNTHIVVVVRFGFTEDENGRPVPNNFVLTAYPVFMGQRR